MKSIKDKDTEIQVIWKEDVIHYDIQNTLNKK